MKVPWDAERVNISVTKNFALKYMSLWHWDFYDLRDALRSAYKVERVGDEKYEVCVERGGFKKIIAVHYSMEEKIVCITGSSGGGRL